VTIIQESHAHVRMAVTLS